MFCPGCAKELKEDAIFCDGCKKILKIPLGLNIVSIVFIILSILGILYGIILLATINVPNILNELLKMKAFETLTKETFTKIGFSLSLSILLFSILYLVIGLGLRRLKRWAGILGIISAILGLFLGYRNIINTLINLLVLILILTNYRYLNVLYRENEY